MSDDDPTRAFLDQTVPRDDAWEGREPDDGPARPRHTQQASDNVHDARERRKQTIRNAAWTFGPGVAYLAGSAAFASSARAEPEPPDVSDVSGFGEIGAGL
ncbi:hypothetical protein [Actinophytocola gossypii]|uniref:Uncharacterized protein n=1 Tax=Actinophytocola gossypii TaxID=2812003 RepID=A0ABT2JGN3_9PSEU|nr:hypothetical protein [Actinophytocola gossypii]MCT2586871.1 hypothetical protein [Actinophytocola gossypii]